MKDNFSNQAPLYAKYRPTYPPALFEYIVSFVANKNTAWDCGTGNGQSALALSDYFKKVTATDISQQQIDNAAKASNIFYSCQPAEQTTIENNSIDLVTVAQAIHWFDFDKFYNEVKRVAAKDAFIAIWTYSLLQVNGPIDEIISDYHYHFLARYWDAERKYVDDGYRDIPFPFKKINSPSFFIEKNCSLEELEGYFTTWSALQKYVATNNNNPVPDLINSIRPYWGNEDKRKIIFPIHLLAGFIK